MKKKGKGAKKKKEGEAKQWRTWEDVPLGMSLQDVAKVLRVHYNTVRRMVRSGKLPAQKVGRIWRVSRAAVEALLSGDKPPER